MGTPARAVRVRDALWFAAQEACAKEGTSVSAVIVAALERFVERHSAPTVAERAQAERRRRLRELLAAGPPPTDLEVEQLITLLRG